MLHHCIKAGAEICFFLSLPKLRCTAGLKLWFRLKKEYFEANAYFSINFCISPPHKKKREQQQQCDATTTTQISSNVNAKKHIHFITVFSRFFGVYVYVWLFFVAE